MTSIRQFWTRVHRWSGLTLALFLAVAGVTGSLLVWEEPLEALTAPHLLRVAPPFRGAAMRDMAALADAAVVRHPGIVVTYVPLTPRPGESVDLRVAWPDPHRAQGWDELFVDPYTGAELGHRHWGAISEGWVNLMPCIYLLHYTLLLGTWGDLAMGIAALVWTIDCFVGFYLTLPTRALRAHQRPREWVRRWAKAWRVRLPAKPVKLTFDLHRVSGLWLWPALMIFAWSGVAFNLPQVYQPVMRLFGARDPAPAAASASQRTMSFAAAEARGQALAAVQARRTGAVLSGGDRSLFHPTPTGAFTYGFSTRADIPDDGGASSVSFDGATGVLVGSDLANAAAAADRFSAWLEALHMARSLGLAWRILVTIAGVVVTVLSVTGVLIWSRKRAARTSHRTSARKSGRRKDGRTASA